MVRPRDRARRACLPHATRGTILWGLLVAGSALAPVGCQTPETIPASAEAFARRYEPIRDPEIVRYILDNEFKLKMAIDGGKCKTRRHVYGQGRDEVIITEYLVQGEPYKIERRHRAYYNGLSRIDNRPGRRIKRIRFGRLAGRPSPMAFVVEDEEDLAAVARVMRTGAYRFAYDHVYRELIEPDPVEDETSLPGGKGSTWPFWVSGCGPNIFVVPTEGDEIRWEWSACNTRRGVHHDGLLALLERLTRKYGWRMHSTDSGYRWFFAPPEVFVRWLDDEDESNRTSALRGLGRWGQKASFALGAIEKLRKDPSPEVRALVPKVIQWIREADSRQESPAGTR